MGVIGSIASLAAGATAGVLGGVAAARLLAPKSGQDTQNAIANWSSEIRTAGESARDRAEIETRARYQATVDRLASDPS
ncbi:hypothetical protein BH23CHL5_BH23CHL5_13730 [soil metagenome]